MERETAKDWEVEKSSERVIREADVKWSERITHEWIHSNDK